MELVPAALETRCLILLPAAPGLAPAVLDYYLRNAAFLAPFEPERPAGFYTAEHHARELAADVQRAAQGTGVRFYLALKDVPARHRQRCAEQYRARSVPVVLSGL